MPAMPAAWELPILQCLIRAVSPAAPCSFVSLSEGAAAGTSALGHSMSHTGQRLKPSGLNPQHGEGLGVLLQVLGCRLSIFHVSAVPAAQAGWGEPGGIQAKGRSMGRSSPKNTSRAFAAPPQAFRGDALGTAGPAPGCSAPSSSPFIPPQHPRKRVLWVLSAPQYSGAEGAPRARSASQGCTESLPGVRCTYGIWGALCRAGRWHGLEHWGHLPRCQPSRTCHSSPGACSGRAAHAAPWQSWVL